MKLELNEINQIKGYICDECKGYNDILNPHCIFCNPLKLSRLNTRYLVNTSRCQNLDEYASYVSIRRQAGFLFMSDINMAEDKLELHAKFYNSESIQVAAMDMLQIEERIRDLESIIFEAKAYHNAVSDEKRKRVAKLKLENKEWLITPDGNDPTLTDAIVANKRKRVSKADKLLEQMKSLGVANADELIKNVVKRQTEIDYKASPHSKMISNRLPARNESEETKAEPKPKKIFDPKSLSFNK